MTEPAQPTQSAPESLVGQATKKIDDQATAALSVLEADAIAFIQAAAQHAKDALPLLTGELGNGLNNLIAKAKELADKHGFKL